MVSGKPWLLEDHHKSIITPCLSMIGWGLGYGEDKHPGAPHESKDVDT